MQYLGNACRIALAPAVLELKQTVSSLSAGIRLRYLSLHT